MVMTAPGLIRDGVMDAELLALLWLLGEGGVPLTVIGSADLDARSSVASATLSLSPSRAWVVIDADAETPTPGRLAALLQGGVGLGLTLLSPDLRSMLEGAKSLAELPEDGIRRLGAVAVLDDAGPGLRCRAVHFLRPSERDGQGHVQRRPPAVLASWDERTDRFEHYAWGITPELADRVDRAQADFEDRQRERTAFLQVQAADASGDGGLDQRLLAHLASEPARIPAPDRSRAERSPFQPGSTDSHRH
jgi:hypothetical protein